MNPYDINFKDIKMSITETISYNDHKIIKNEFGQIFAQAIDSPMIYCESYEAAISLIDYWTGGKNA